MRPGARDGGRPRGHADVLLVDEPTSALDQERGADIMDLIARLTHERSTATMLVTHDLVHRESLDDLVTVVDER